MKKLHNPFYKLLFIASFLLPFSIAASNLYFGTIPFWYDPARDLLMALDNHQKISLIGQTSGIPGIFYGPFWIWFLSLALFISHDPRIVAFLVLTLPYFLLFPVLLFKFKKQFGQTIPLLLWLLFALSFSPYSTQLWNPHLAPLFCLLTIYLLVSQDYNRTKWKEYFKILVAGLSGGLLINIHISFGLAVITGSYVFLLFCKNKLKTWPLFSAGLLATFLPFFAFESRHGFNQIKTVLATITSSSAVVKETSVDKLQIVNLFFGSFAHLLQIPTIVAYWVIGILLVYCILLFKKKKLKINQEEKKLLLIIGSIVVTTLCIYLTTKNPVWEYHFIGVEILFLLLLGFLAKKSKVITYALICWIIVLAVISVTNFVKGFSTDPYKVSSLATKEHIIDTIYQDAGTKTFSVYTFSPATFTPDYDYLLRWKGESKKSLNLRTGGKGELVYLIIPWTTKDLKADFIDNRTPHKKFKTVKTWHIADETDIIKRVRYEK
jgi:uncharacterized membrane protein YuzA (DUF378 family)